MRLSTLPPDQACVCGEVMVLVGTHHSGWGDHTARCCAWCFGGGKVPRELNGVWLDGEYRTGDDQRLVELYVVAFRRIAARREPDLDLRSHDEALAVWDLLARRRAWDIRMVTVWGAMMRDPRLSLGDGRALIRPNAWESPKPPVVRPARPATWQLMATERTGLTWLLDGQDGDLARTSPGRRPDSWLRDAMSLLVAESHAYDEALVAVAAGHGPPDVDEEGPSLTEAATRMAAMWASDAVAVARRCVDNADALRTVTSPVDELDVLGMCVALRRAHGTLLVLLAPSEIRTLLVVWYARAVRPALMPMHPRHKLALLPGRDQVLAQVEQLLRPPADDSARRDPQT